MMELSGNINEKNAAKAFSLQAPVFDELYGTDSIIQYKRDRVRAHINEFLRANSDLLELNCGTGEDALYFAGRGHKVHATDISEGMLGVLKQKAARKGYNNDISVENCSFTQLDNLAAAGPYDHIYSNFGGLNCTGELDRVLLSLGRLVKPSGVITLVIISKFCLWEMLLLFKGKFKTAFRRFFSKKGRSANIEGTKFRCWYYSPSYVIDQLKKDFDPVAVEGLCTIVPPSYISGFAVKYPGIYKWLCNKEDQLKGKAPWKYTGDYFIISLQKKPLQE